MYFILSLLIISIGLYGILSSRNLIRIIININIMELGVNLLLIIIGFRPQRNVPILPAKDVLISSVDPLPQAMVLTAIVIGFATTALALVIIRLYQRKSGSYVLEKSIYERMRENAVANK